jgi:soluble lytic murein transglycosylase-like protein
MRLRMLSLLLVAVGSGTLVGLADSAPAGKPRALAAVAATRSSAPCPIPAQFRDEFRLAAADTNLPVAMIVAVAKVESRFDANARSAAGAHGLLQVLPSTAAELKLNPYHAGENVLAGARYLRQMLDRFDSTELAFAAYNAGPTAVERYGARPNDETVAYVERVTSEWRKLVGCS